MRGAVKGLGRGQAAPDLQTSLNRPREDRGTGELSD